MEDAAAAGAAAGGGARLVDTSAWKAAVGTPAYKAHQTSPTPSPGAGDRVFYESLFRELPSSDMALIWCIEHGVFLPEEHARLVGKYLAAKAHHKKGGVAPSPARKA